MAPTCILVGHDGSSHARDALALGRLLCELTDAELVLARVVPWEPLPLQAVPIPELKNRYEAQERDALAELRWAAERVGASTEAGPGESPAQGLQLLAEELNPDVVVVGSSHRGRIGQVMAGNVALRLLNGLDRPLAVAPAGYAQHAGELRRIGVGFDGSPESLAALRKAGRLAVASQAKVWVIAVAPQTGVGPHAWGFAPGVAVAPYDLDGRLRRSLESAAGDLPAGVARATELHSGDPAAVLLDEARALDLLVLGSRGYGPVRRVLLGSVSGRVVREAPCPLLVVPRPGTREPDERSDPVAGASRA
jgi:nucleotide-binding universal stress UspA family protein